MAFGRKKKADLSPAGDVEGRDSKPDSDRTLTDNDDKVAPTAWQLKRATKTRKTWTIISAFLLFCSVIFTIMVEIGNTSNKPGLTNLYFIRLNLTNVFPASLPNATLLNSIARSLGLYDYYQVGLWNYCGGYNDGGIQSCSKTQTLYWFNPVSIIQSQLFAGASIALPAELVNILGLIRTVSHFMFGLFLASACLSTVMIPIQLASVYSRWLALLVMIFTFLSALCVTVATVIATILFIIMRNVFVTNTTVNIGAHVGVPMFAMMWTATATAIVAWLIQLCLCCCCASRRDVEKGKKRGSKKAWEGSPQAAAEQNKRRFFARRRREPDVLEPVPEEPVMTSA